GWLGPARHTGDLEFSTKREDLEARRTLPAFKIREWRAGMLAKLPAPARPFGLDLTEAEMRDSRLKDLAPLKQLTALNLHRHLTTANVNSPSVTDAGLKELAPLKQLTTLDLSYTEVTE